MDTYDEIGGWRFPANRRKVPSGGFSRWSIRHHLRKEDGEIAASFCNDLNDSVRSTPVSQVKYPPLRWCAGPLQNSCSGQLLYGIFGQSCEPNTGLLSPERGPVDKRRTGNLTTMPASHSSAKAMMLPTPAVVRILDQDEAVLRDVTCVLESQQIHCRGYCNSEEFFSADQSPSCALIDFLLDGSEGFAVANRCRERWPKSAVILTSGEATVRFAVRAMRHGLDGVLQKPICPRELVSEIFAAQARSEARSTISEAQADARRRMQKLRDCELQVLHALADGLPNKGIAARLNLATRTIEKYRRMLFDNLDVDSAAEAVRIFVLGSMDSNG